MEATQLIAIISILAQVTFLEGILSLDNAAVLGAVVLPLPTDQPVPWPKALAGVGQALRRVLGFQRTAALRVGLLGAYLGRGIMLLMASFVIRNPWLQLLGALYLLKISAGELAHLNEGDSDEPEKARKSRERGFWATVLTVELMDLAFSLDNVVVVVSLTDKLWIVLVGVALGILTMRFAAGIFSSLIEKVPALGPAAYVLVFNIGIEFILGRLGVALPEAVRFGANIGILAAAVIYSRWAAVRRVLRIPFAAFMLIFRLINLIFTAVLGPLGWASGKLEDYFSLSSSRLSLPESGND